MQQLLHEQDNIRIVDLKRPEYLEINDEMPPFVARVGLFDDDMFVVNIPFLTWYCRKDGTIYPEWNIYDRHQKQTVQRAKMIKSTVNVLNPMTKELWTMHKMGSDTLL